MLNRDNVTGIPSRRNLELAKTPNIMKPWEIKDGWDRGPMLTIRELVDSDDMEVWPHRTQTETDTETPRILRLMSVPLI